jgi:hypothetical protein
MPVKNWLIAAGLIVGLLVLILIARGNAQTPPPQPPPTLQQQEQKINQLIFQLQVANQVMADLLSLRDMKKNQADQITQQLRDEVAVLDQMKKGGPASVPAPAPAAPPVKK